MNRIRLSRLGVAFAGVLVVVAVPVIMWAAQEDGGSGPTVDASFPSPDATVSPVWDPPVASSTRSPSASPADVTGSPTPTSSAAGTPSARPNGSATSPGETPSPADTPTSPGTPAPGTTPASPGTPAPAGTKAPSTTVPTATPGEPARPTAVVVAGCQGATVTVSTSRQLDAALNDARPGDLIALVDGTYSGEFSTSVSGTESRPITLCGSGKAILEGDGPDGGYVFHLDGADYWNLRGFTVRNGQKGVMADGTTGSRIEGLTVYNIGDEAIHLRKYSTNNVVAGNTVYQTGLRKPKFGEGVYIGTAESNWCSVTNCEPDRSDNNLIEGNSFWSISAEAIDLKEGTTGGIVRGNSFDGAGIDADGADSWVDVKGNNWLIEGNVGVNTPMDGFQVHRILDGWGKGNVFRSNVADVNGPGFGFSLTPVQDNVVECSNTVSRAAEGYSNVACVG